MVENKKVTLTEDEIKILEKAGDILSNIARRMAMYDYDYCEATGCIVCRDEDLKEAICTLDYFCVSSDIFYNK